MPHSAIHNWGLTGTRKVLLRSLPHALAPTAPPFSPVPRLSRRPRDPSPGRVALRDPLSYSVTTTACTDGPRHPSHSQKPSGRNRGLTSTAPHRVSWHRQPPKCSHSPKPLPDRFSAGGPNSEFGTLSPRGPCQRRARNWPWAGWMAFWEMKSKGRRRRGGIVGTWLFCATGVWDPTDAHTRRLFVFSYTASFVCFLKRTYIHTCLHSLRNFLQWTRLYCEVSADIRKELEHCSAYPRKDTETHDYRLRGLYANFSQWRPTYLFVFFYPSPDKIPRTATLLTPDVHAVWPSLSFSLISWSQEI